MLHYSLKISTLVAMIFFVLGCQLNSRALNQKFDAYIHREKIDELVISPTVALFSALIKYQNHNLPDSRYFDEFREGQRYKVLSISSSSDSFVVQYELNGVAAVWSMTVTNSINIASEDEYSQYRVNLSCENYLDKKLFEMNLVESKNNLQAISDENLNRLRLLTALTGILQNENLKFEKKETIENLNEKNEIDIFFGLAFCGLLNVATEDCR